MENLLSPLKIALIGLGTGFYLGEAVKKDDSGVVAFYIGAFGALLFFEVMHIGISGAALVLIIAVLFSFSMNISRLIESQESYRESFNVLARDGSRTSLIAITILQYGFVFFIWLVDVELGALDLVSKLIVLVGILVAGAIVWRFISFLDDVYSPGEDGAADTEPA